MKALVYSGSMNLIIDGLNEADADTRAKISTFLTGNKKCNSLIATQSISWEPPSHAIVYEFLPISFSEIGTFMKSRLKTFDDLEISENEYDSAVDSWLSHNYRVYESEQISDYLIKTIFNLMDLTTASQLISQKISPNLFSLQQQQFKLAKSYYEETHADYPFPLKRFSEYVFNMKLEQQYELNDDFNEELFALKKYKMVLKRTKAVGDNSSKTIWYFRHEKIMDYFISITFVDNEERQKALMKDQRFREVYLMLAYSLSDEKANQLERDLLDYAVEEKDHNLHDEYYKNLKLRKAFLN